MKLGCPRQGDTSSVVGVRGTYGPVIVRLQGMDQAQWQSSSGSCSVGVLCGYNKLGGEGLGFQVPGPGQGSRLIDRRSRSLAGLFHLHRGLRGVLGKAKLTSMHQPNNDRRSM